jgi:hypothetical protein
VIRDLSFVLNRNWRLWGQAARKRVAVSARERALGRPLLVFDIFTNSSCSSEVRNAKGCVCTSLLLGEAAVSELQKRNRSG